jgi:hypothetical protein
MKNFSRLNQKKYNCKIVFEIKKLSYPIEEPTKVQIVWKRGPETQESEIIELNPYSAEVELNERFVKVSTFYSKDERITHEPKVCDILLMKVDEDDETKKDVIAKVQNYNMADFVRVNKTELPTKINFDAKDIFIEAVWTIFNDEGLTKQATTAGEPTTEVYT